MLRQGEPLHEAGYVEGPKIENQVCGQLPWFGSMPDVERRLRDLQQQRDVAQARLDGALREPATAEPGTCAVAEGETAVEAS